MITLKTNKQISWMKIAGRALAGWFEELLYTKNKHLKPGFSTEDILKAFMAYTKGLPHFADEYAWDTVFDKVGDFGCPICTSVNDVIVHGRPTSDTLKDGDIVTVDAGFSYNGWCADAARTFIVGAQSASSKILHTLTQETKRALDLAIDMCRPGNTLVDIATVISGVAKLNGYGVVIEYTGHGIGAKLHEEPLVHNSVKGIRVNTVLRPGMTICIEPMFTLGSGAVTKSADNWAVYTADGFPAAHFEDTVLITDGNPEILTR